MTPEVAHRIKEAKEFQSLLRTARLCRLRGFLPAAGAVEDISMPLQWAADKAPIACRFTPLLEQRGVYRVYVNLPPNRRVLSLVVADLAWGKPTDLTRVRLHESWSDRPTPAVDVPEVELGARTVVSLAAASKLQAETSPAHTLREHIGESWDVNALEQPWSVRIVGLARKMLFPLPILLGGLAVDGHVMAEEVRMVSHSGEDLENLFETCNERVHWLQVASLALDDTHRLAPRHAAELLGASKYAVCLLEPVPGSTGEYTVDLSDAAVQERLDSRHVVLALQIAEVERQVQP
jgi:hypothetical protein